MFHYSLICIYIPMKQIIFKSCHDVWFYALLLLWNRKQRKIKNKILCDKPNDFTFPIVNFPFINCNIPATPAYGVYISQLIRHSRDFNFLNETQLLMHQLLDPGNAAPRLTSSLQTFYMYDRHREMVDRYEIFISQMVMDLFFSIWIISCLYHRQDPYRIRQY